MSVNGSLRLFFEDRTQNANASETQPAKLLSVFVVDANETELTIPFGELRLVLTEQPSL